MQCGHHRFEAYEEYLYYPLCFWLYNAYCSGFTFVFGLIYLIWSFPSKKSTCPLYTATLKLSINPLPASPQTLLTVPQPPTQTLLNSPLIASPSSIHIKQYVVFNLINKQQIIMTEMEKWSYSVIVNVAKNISFAEVIEARNLFIIFVAFLIYNYTGHH